ncbi:hypothetical protein B4U84_11170 [Westiellopsis prolifica IICB1]|nr:hypothetical protein B4U84_11170 [Westiellopsis prolifica IICB1]
MVCGLKDRGSGIGDRGSGRDLLNNSPHTSRRDESRLYITPHTPRRDESRLYIISHTPLFPASMFPLVVFVYFI